MISSGISRSAAPRGEHLGGRATAGLGSLLTVIGLGAICYLAGLRSNKRLIAGAIGLSVAALLYCKYLLFGANSLAVLGLPSSFVESAARYAPAVIPLGISFFVFEF